MLKQSLKLVDVVIEVRDARIPLATSHPQVNLGGRANLLLFKTCPIPPLGVLFWVDGFAIGVVRMLIGTARTRSVCESVRNANPSRRRGSH